jgi:rhamnogalacturonan endolyase
MEAMRIGFRSTFAFVAGLSLFFAAIRLPAQYRMEKLGRGTIALRASSTDVFVSWRLLGTDPADLAFNLYRSTGGAPAVKLNVAPLTTGTNYVDQGADLSQANAYFVRPVLGGVEQAPGAAFTLPANAPVRQYLSIPLQSPPTPPMPDNSSYSYSPNDCSVGDLDGDGEYEIVVKWDPSNSKDNSQSGYTGNVFLDAYRLDGTRLWRIDLGRNIRAGAHYTQFMVYDLDGDGKAEIACKTADGTVDGVGHVIGNASADYRNSAGYVLTGPEYLTIFDGQTGAALTTVAYDPPRNNDVTSSDVSAWGDNYGNRVDRFLACIAYLDGKRPSLVMCRGYYTRTVLVAYDWRDHQLTRRWVFDSDDGTPGNLAYRGQGDHSLSVGDVDGDGRDEIIYGSCAIDDNGTGLYVSAINGTELGHGDAMHLSDLDPNRPGQEVWQCHEDYATNGGIGLSMRDAGTGQILWTVRNTSSDTGRALAADIDPRYPGYECWGATGGLYSAQGKLITNNRPSSMNFAVWWDGDLLREILDSNHIDKWDWTTNSLTRLLTATNCTSNNGTKATPCLSADILGDWREEVIWRTSDNQELRIYSTTIPTAYRFYTLMHDPQYRAAIAWQNVAYNQPPHPGFFLGDGMSPAPAPYITTDERVGSSHLTSLSARTMAGVGDQTLIVGFAIGGSGRQPVLVRGVGPTLTGYGVGGVLADPVLTLYDVGGTVLGTNDDWWRADNAALIASTAQQVWAFALPNSSHDAALLPTLDAGGYTAHVTAATGGPGIALLEVYAAGGEGTAPLSSLSARAQVGTGEGRLIAGFVISGPVSKTVLVRAVGPSLAAYGVATPLADPQLDVYRGSTRIAGNDDWGKGSGVTAATFAACHAFPLPAGSKDAALLLTLSPGLYTAQCSGVGGTTGVALVEVYDTGD